MGGGLFGKGSRATSAVGHGDCSPTADAFTGNAPAGCEATLSTSKKSKKESFRRRACVALSSCTRRMVFRSFLTRRKTRQPNRSCTSSRTQINEHFHGGTREKHRRATVRKLE